MSQPGCGCTVTPGSIMALLAGIMSYALNQSIWWAILHFILGPFYLIYVVIWRAKEVLPALTAMFS